MVTYCMVQFDAG